MLLNYIFFFFNNFQMSFMFIINIFLIILLGIFFNIYNFFINISIFFALLLLLIYMFLIIIFLYKLERLIFFFYNDNSKTIIALLSIVFYFLFIDNNIAFCANGNGIDLSLNSIEQANIVHLKNHLVTLNSANFNISKNIYIEDLKSKFFLEDLMTHTSFIETRDAFMMDDIIDFERLSVEEMFIISEILTDIQINPPLENKFHIFPFEASLNEDGFLEIDLQEFRSLKSFISCPQFDSFWNSDLLNDYDINIFLNNNNVSDYPTLYFNSFKFEKHLIEYIDEYEQLIQIHNYMLENNINTQILQNNYSIDNIFHVNNPCLSVIKSNNYFYSAFL